MANSPSAAKRARQNERRRIQNVARRSRVRTFVKRVIGDVESGDSEAARKSLREAESELDKAAGKGVLHSNTAARVKRRLVKKVKAIS